MSTSLFSREQTFLRLTCTIGFWASAGQQQRAPRLTAPQASTGMVSLSGCHPNITMVGSAWVLGAWPGWSNSPAGFTALLSTGPSPPSSMYLLGKQVSGGPAGRSPVPSPNIQSAKNSQFWKHSPQEAAEEEMRCEPRGFFSLPRRDCDTAFRLRFQCCSSVTKLGPTLWDPMNCSMPGFPVLHHLPEFAQMHAHWVGDGVEASHPLPPVFPFAFNLSQHQGLFQWVCSLYQVAKVLELQLQHQPFQWLFRTDFL